MKVHVSGDEQWPVYAIKIPKAEDGYSEDELLDLDEDFVKRFNKAQKSFDELHFQLSHKVDEFEAKRERRNEKKQ